MKHFFMLVFLSCSICLHAQKRADKTNLVAESEYVYSFRWTYYKSFLRSGFERSACVQEILMKDGSGYNEPILSAEDYRFIDSLAAKNIVLLNQQFLLVQKRQGGVPRIRILESGEIAFNSKWLRKLAKERYKLMEQ